MAKLPTVTSQVPLDLRMFLDRVREALDSNSLDAAVTARQLVAAGVASYVGNTLASVEADTYSTPAAPSGVATSGALASVILTWGQPSYSGHSYAEIWASDGLNALIGDAVLVGMSPGTFFAHSIGAGGSRTYWVRFVNYNGLAGPYHATDGTNGQTSQSPSYLMDVLTEAYGSDSESPFFQLDAATTINGVSIPAGTYMKTAFVVDGSITRAKIGDAAIDNAKIANLDAGKITTGYISGQRIEAGSIDANMIDSRGLSIKNANGDIILAAGTPLAVANVSGLGNLATVDDITMSSVTDAGGFATLDQISATNVSTYIASAAIDLAQIKTASITDLSSLSVDAGTITAGVLQSSDGNFTIDLTNKTISIET
jgi:hypothetical protein